ncbi:NrfD/PsrC family molybdoenzyme membrane anchor subunit [Haloactinomyces albus]|uniref:DMSO reductase anchor subunit n=1 Tax=Haloactinomyces albus TaxID=1352928 RepID=A0AAE3ZAT6_9ACTN|nr:NrfD/PsrC family molybdoenzyme membrane anchor subunit [Haloactinomyces albus]MDR7300094.1 DMSO reductase anchor subunit [Haloactinomyces albus]
MNEQHSGGEARRNRRSRDKQAVVPEAEFDSYYGRPVIKPPVWKVPDVPAYLYLGGTAGVSSLMGEFAALTGRPRLRRVGRLAGSVGSLASVGALIHDLGRPERFLNMLRVFKPTSPLSVGTWILSPFSAMASATAVSEVTGLLPTLARISGATAGVLGPAMVTYTAVLLSDTAVPAWHEGYRKLPFVFAGSALTSGAAVAMVAVPTHEAAPARRLAAGGAGLEIAAATLLEKRIGLPGQAYHRGRAGKLMRIARACTVAGGLAAPFAGRSRVLSVLAGLSLTAGAVVTRFGVFEAGMASARDPQYTVVPQRERLAERAAAEG